MQLKVVGISYLATLLNNAGTHAARTNLSERTKIPVEELDRLARRAALRRLDDMGAMFVDLLEQFGVNHVVQLKERLKEQGPDKFHRLLADFNHNGGQRILRRGPSLDEVNRWHEQMGEDDFDLMYAP